MGMPSSTRASRYAQCYWVPGGPSSRSPCWRRSPIGEVGDRVAFQANGVVEVELLETAGRNRAVDPVLAALRVSGGDLALRAGRQVFLVCQGFPAGPLTEAGPPILAGWAAFNVRVGRLALFHLGFGSRPHQREPPLSQRLRGPHMGRVVIVWCRPKP